MNRNIKKCLSLILTIAFAFTFCFSSFADNNSSPMADSLLSNQELIQSINGISNDLYTQFPELKEINNKTIRLLQNGTDPKEIINKIPKDDLKKLRDIYKEIDLAAATDNNFEEYIYGYLEGKGYNAKEYIQNIEDRANKLYEYYKQHNKFPESYDIESNSIQNTMAATYDPALAAMGYSVTPEMLSAQLAALSAICATAFPYIALIALLAGATILVASIIYDYVEYYSDVNAQVIDWYGTSCRERVLKSCADTQSLVIYRTMYNIRYWKAFLCDFAGLGGIIVTEPMTQSQATAWLMANSSLVNTYAVSGSDAALAAGGASIGGSPVMDPAHTGDGKILNKPHYHPTIYGQRSDSHSFFGL